MEQNKVVYVNGLDILISPSEVSFNFRFNTEKATSLVCSYQYFKSLVNHLEQTLEDLEKTMGTQIQSSEDVQLILSNASSDVKNKAD